MVDSTSSPGVRCAVVVLLALLALPMLSGGAAAQEASEGPSAGGQPAGEAEEADSERTSELSLSVAPVVGEGPEDGDLATDAGTGLPTLTFSPSTPTEQRAVLLFTVTNTGDVPVSEVGITDDRIGTVLEPASATTLGPGESATVRAGATFTFEEAAGGTAGLVVTGAQATASDDTGATVQAAAEWTIQVVAVLQAPTATIDLEALVGAGDVVAGVGGTPTVSWSAEEAAVGDERTIHYRLTITNTGPVELVEVTAVVEVLGARLPAVADDTVLAPGESVVVEVSRTLTPDEMGGDPATGVEVRAVADLQATDGTGRGATASDDAVVFAVVVQPDELVEEEALPAAGPAAAAGLLTVAVAALLVGAGLLLVSRRRTVAAARPPHRRAAAWCPRA